MKFFCKYEMYVIEGICVDSKLANLNLFLIAKRDIENGDMLLTQIFLLHTDLSYIR